MHETPNRTTTTKKKETHQLPLNMDERIEIWCLEHFTMCENNNNQNESHMNIWCLKNKKSVDIKFQMNKTLKMLEIENIMCLCLLRYWILLMWWAVELNAWTSAINSKYMQFRCPYMCKTACDNNAQWCRGGVYTINDFPMQLSWSFLIWLAAISLVSPQCTQFNGITFTIRMSNLKGHTTESNRH